MATKVAVASRLCLEDGLWLPPHHENLLQLALIADPNLPQQLSLLRKTFLLCLETDKGCTTNIAGTNDAMKFFDVTRYCIWIRWSVGKFQL